MHWLELFFERVSTALVYVATLAVLALTGFVCLSAIMRYAIGSPFHFTEELVALLFLAMVFLTLPYATVGGKHIRVTLVTGRLKSTWGSVATLFNLAIVAIFSAWFAWEAFGFTRFSYEIGAISEQSSIVLWPWMGLIPLSFALVSAISLIQFVRGLGRGPEDG